MQNAVQDFGVMIGVLLVAYYAGKTLLDRYFVNQDKLETLREKFTDKSISTVQDEMKMVRTQLHDNILKVQENTKQLAVICTKLDIQKGSFDRLLTSIKKIYERTDQRLQDIEDSELEQIDENHWRFRRKNGK
jgi:methyl-accepting chemotaxis protein